MLSRHHLRRHWPRLTVAGFALCLMLLMVFHAPVGAFAFSGQHTAGSHVDHPRQPCLDSASFDSTLPETGFSLAVLPHSTRQTKPCNQVAWAPNPSEFRLYNRPPPVS